MSRSSPGAGSRCACREATRRQISNFDALLLIVRAVSHNVGMAQWARERYHPARRLGAVRRFFLNLGNP